MDLPPLPTHPLKVIVMTEQTAPGPKLQLEERVRLAFESVRRDDLSGVTELQSAGAPLVPLLTKYLQDDTEAVRREAVSLLTCVASPAALPHLIAALNDASADVRERAARAVYEKFDVASLLAQSELEKNLLALVGHSEPPATAALLLAYFPSEASRAALLKLCDRHSRQLVKLYEWSTPIELELVAKVALARHGELTAQRAVLETIQSASASQAEFLLAAIREIDSSLLLRELSKLLSDEREATTLVHSAPNIRPRICDLAVNAFVKRLELSVSFAHTEYRHYQPQQRDEVQRRVEQLVPPAPIPKSPR